MIYFIVSINTVTWIYVIFFIRDVKNKQSCKKGVDEAYVNGLIDKALLETENDIK
jgi:hypothetical protein